MTIFSSRSVETAQDRKHLIDFWIDHRAAGDVRRDLTTWRLRLLLTSRVWNVEKDTRIWETAAGHIAGMAMLWRRKPSSPSNYLLRITLIASYLILMSLI